MTKFTFVCCLFLQENWIAPAVRGTGEQKAALLSYLELRPMLAQKEYGCAAGRVAAQAEWKTLADDLNQIPGGAQKSAVQWMQVHYD